MRRIEAASAPPSADRNLASSPEPQVVLPARVSCAKMRENGPDGEGPMAQTAQLRRIEVAENEAQRVFNLQREAYRRHPYPSLEERRANLDKLERIMVDNSTAIA